MRADVQAMTGEVGALREDIASLKSGEYSPEVLTRVQTRMDQVNTRMDEMGLRLDEISAMPKTMLDYSIEKLGSEAAQTVNGIRGCVPAGGDA